MYIMVRVNRHTCTWKYGYMKTNVHNSTVGMNKKSQGNGIFVTECSQIIFLFLVLGLREQGRCREKRENIARKHEICTCRYGEKETMYITVRRK